MVIADKRILIAEDEDKASDILRRVLTKMNWQIDIAPDGETALGMLKKNSYDALLTDLNMPRMNGMELISRVQGEIASPPRIIMVSAFIQEDTRKRAMDLGAHAVLSKPVDFKELGRILHGAFSGKPPSAETGSAPRSSFRESEEPLPHPLVVVGVSTGGPPALCTLFGPWVQDLKAPVLVVMHSPSWAIESIVQNLSETLMSEDTFRIAQEGETPLPGRVYFAPGRKHMTIDNGTRTLKLNEGPFENFVCPSADPLFRSASRAYGSMAIGVIMTGLGKDGAVGALKIQQEGGSLLIQAPETCAAPFMPQAALEVLENPVVAPLEKLSNELKELVRIKVSLLNQALKKAEGRA